MHKNKLLNIIISKDTTKESKSFDYASVPSYLKTDDKSNEKEKIVMEWNYKKYGKYYLVILREIDTKKECVKFAHSFKNYHITYNFTIVFVEPIISKFDKKWNTFRKNIFLDFFLY